MGNQRTFASMAWNGKGKVTRRERFLAEMDAVIPYGPPLDLSARQTGVFPYDLLDGAAHRSALNS